MAHGAPRSSDASTAPHLPEQETAAPDDRTGRWIRKETRELPEVRRLLAHGRRQGYLTPRDLTDSLSSDLMDDARLAEMRAIVNEYGIRVTSAAKRAALTRSGGRGADEAPTNDPVRVYLREMGQVSLLTR